MAMRVVWSLNVRAIVVAALIAFAGCETYRIRYPGELAQRGAGTTHPYVVLEFGERGNARDGSQKDVALAEIRKLRKPLLVIFVHGWHNNAATGDAEDPDRLPKHSFSQLLDALGDSAYIREQGFQPLGVYISWRGKSYQDVVLEYGTTFWHRYDAARDLGRTIPCRRAISELVAEARERGPKDSRTFLIGHSFGGLVLEQAITSSVVSAQRDGVSLPPADLTLFLNPASDSETALFTVDALASKGVRVGSWDEKRDFPIFASLTSESDWATGLTFPIGKYPAALGKQFDSYEVDGPEERVSGRYFFTHTPGHNRYLLSHATTAPRPIAGTGTSAFEANLREKMDPEEPHFKTLTPGKGWESWCIKRTGTTVTPYWIVKVSKAIMNGHNDIFNDNALALMAALYRLNHQFTEETGVRPVLQGTSARREVKVQSGAATAAKIRDVMSRLPEQSAPAQKRTPSPATAPAAPSRTAPPATPPPAATPSSGERPAAPPPARLRQKRSGA